MCWKLIAAVYDSSCRPNTRHNLVLLILVVQQTIVCLPGLGTDGNMYCLELASTQLVSKGKSYFPLMRTATCRTLLRVYTPTMYAPVINLWRKKACLENVRVPPTNFVQPWNTFWTWAESSSPRTLRFTSACMAVAHVVFLIPGFVCCDAREGPQFCLTWPMWAIASSLWWIYLVWKTKVSSKSRDRIKPY
jgi:hypothetical protein